MRRILTLTSLALSLSFLGAGCSWFGGQPVSQKQDVIRGAKAAPAAPPSGTPVIPPEAKNVPLPTVK